MVRDTTVNSPKKIPVALREKKKKESNLTFIKSNDTSTSCPAVNRSTVVICPRHLKYFVQQFVFV